MDVIEQPWRFRFFKPAGKVTPTNEFKAALFDRSKEFRLGGKVAEARVFAVTPVSFSSVIDVSVFRDVRAKVLPEMSKFLHDGGRVKPTKVVRPMLMSFRSVNAVNVSKDRASVDGSELLDRSNFFRVMGNVKLCSVVRPIELSFRSVNAVNVANDRAPVDGSELLDRSNFLRFHNRGSIDSRKTR